MCALNWERRSAKFFKPLSWALVKASAAEISRYEDKTLIYNGFANRILLLLSARPEVYRCDKFGVFAIFKIGRATYLNASKRVCG